MTIVWTPEAKRTFNEILNYLHNQFSPKQVDVFYFEIEHVLDLIKRNPYLFKKAETENIHRVVIHKYTSLYFEETVPAKQ